MSKKYIIGSFVFVCLVGFQFLIYKFYGNLKCENILEKEDISFAKEFLGLISEGKSDQASAYFDETNKVEFAKIQDNLKSELQKTKGLEEKIIGCNVHSKNSSGVLTKEVNINFQWANDSSASWGNIVWRDSDSKRTVLGLNLRDLPQRLEKLNAFNLMSKGIVHWIFLVLVTLIPLFIIYTLIVCYRTPNLVKKWLWMAFISVGLWKFTFNWTTGEITTPFSGPHIEFINLQLLGVAFGQISEFSPYLIVISIPVGAIVFLIKRKSISAAGKSDGLNS